MKEITFDYRKEKPVHKGFYKVFAYIPGMYIASYWNGKNFVGNFGPWDRAWFIDMHLQYAKKGCYTSIRIKPVFTWTGLAREN